MKKGRFTDEQITFALGQAETGTPVADVCRQMGCSEASFYLWKKRFGHRGATELRELRLAAEREQPAEAAGGRPDAR